MLIGAKQAKTTTWNAMIISTVDSSVLKALLQTAITNDITNLELYLKGIDYSYYYEQEEGDVFAE